MTVAQILRRRPAAFEALRNSTGLISRACNRQWKIDIGCGYRNPVMMHGAMSSNRASVHNSFCSRLGRRTHHAFSFADTLGTGSAAEQSAVSKNPGRAGAENNSQVVRRSHRPSVSRNSRCPRFETRGALTGKTESPMLRFDPESSATARAKVSARTRIVR
jgi:hypothetical protein